MDEATAPTIFEDVRLSAEALATLADGVPTTDSRPPIEVRTPVTDDLIGSIPSCEAADVSEAAERGRAAGADWAETPVSERAAVIERFGDLVLDRRDRLLDLIQLETGKARGDALEEVLGVAVSTTYHANHGPDALAEDRRAGALPLLTGAVVTYDPVGLVGVISPWNYPMMLSLTDVIPALLAGNAVVCKPDPRTPFTALELVSLFEAAGLPRNVLQVVTGDGAAGSAVVDVVDYVAFTGGTETGRAVAARAGRNLTDCSLELGGKNPMVVLADADVEAAARGACKGAFTNAGQLCLATERIYVHESVASSFLKAFVTATENLTLGLAFEYGPEVGSLIDGDHLESVRDQVEAAVDSGATLRAGGRARPDVGPAVYEPTILTDVPPEATLAREETFGPVVSVTPVPDAETAIERANDSPYGLNASVWTRDRERGLSIARDIDCGTVSLNDAYIAGWAAEDAPMGGMKNSGIGRRHGSEGIRRFLEPRTVASSRIGPLTAPAAVSNRTAMRALLVLTRLQRRLTRWLS